jgi:hypothetical protein
VGRSDLFVRRRDGRIEVRLNEFARQFVRDQLTTLSLAQEDAHHAWYAPLSAPIDPSRDDDDPLRTLERQKASATNVELALMTVDDEFLNEAEAWAWLSSLQRALRALASTLELASLDDVRECEHIEIEIVVSLQQLLFALAEVLA